MQSTDKQEASNTEAVKKLIELLQGEMSACQTYRKALESVKDCSCTKELQSAMACHQKRSQTLTEKVKEMGAEPSLTLGGWGAFANTLDAGAAMLGEQTAIAMLENGEDHGLKQYKGFWKDSNAIVSKLVQQFLPKQQETHRAMKELKSKLAAV